MLCGWEKALISRLSIIGNPRSFWLCSGCETKRGSLLVLLDECGHLAHPSSLSGWHRWLVEVAVTLVLPHVHATLLVHVHYYLVYLSQGLARAAEFPLVGCQLAYLPIGLRTFIQFY